MNDTNKKVILVVDDIESIRTAMQDYFSFEYKVITADNGITALSILESEKVDLLITDIRMPEMGGLELIRNMRKSHPNIPFALMTAYNVDDYIHYARREKIWNIIPKTTFLDLRFVAVMIKKLIFRTIFGPAHYFPGAEISEPLTVENSSDLDKISSSQWEENKLYQVTIHGMEMNNLLNELVSEYMISSGAPLNIRQILEELTSNALVRAPVPDSNKDAISNPETRTICRSQTIDTVFGICDGYAIVSVTDHHGTLDRNEILYRLERQVTIDTNTGLPVGVSDLHGRGLFISREHTDHLIFNILPGLKTEVIALVGLDSDLRNRAISIYQEDADDSEGSSIAPE